MLGSRYLNPYFGSGIYTWASLISVVLAALCIGYFIGGLMADRYPSATVLGTTVLIGSAYILVLPLFSERLMEFVLGATDDVQDRQPRGRLRDPVLSPSPSSACIRRSASGCCCARRKAPAASPARSMAFRRSAASPARSARPSCSFRRSARGRSRSTLGVAGILSGLLLVLLRTRSAALLIVITFAALAGPGARADELVDPKIRADMLTRADGRIAHIETEYNDIFINKRGRELTMSFQLKGYDYTELIANLTDPDDLPVRYTQIMTVGMLYPPEVKRVLMIGLGGGSISSYLGRFMPDVDDRHRGGRSGRHHGREELFRHDRDAARALSRGRRARFPQPQQGQLRPDPGRRLPRRLCAVPSADEGVLHAGQAAPRARGRGRVQRARRHQALCLDADDVARGLPRRAPVLVGHGRDDPRGNGRGRARRGNARRPRQGVAGEIPLPLRIARAARAPHRQVRRDRSPASFSPTISRPPRSTTRSARSGRRSNAIPSPARCADTPRSRRDRRRSCSCRTRIPSAA